MELREFVSYARARISPVFTPEAEVRLVESYIELRRQCRNEGVSACSSERQTDRGIVLT